MTEELSLREQLDEAAGDEEVIAFAPKEEQISSEAENASEKVEDANVAEGVGEPEEIQAIEPPHSWRADKKEIFRSLPPEVQQYISERESERDSYLNQKGQRYSSLDKVLEKYEDKWQRDGHSTDKVISQLLAWNDYITENPLEAITELAHRSGLNLQQLAQVHAAQGPQDPYTAKLLDEVRQLKEERIKEQEAKKTHELTQLERDIETFKNATENGKLKHTYFEDLRHDMAALLPRVFEENPNMSNNEVLRECYERALRANPKTFSAYQKQLEAQREAENRQRMQRKKQAGASIAGSPDGGVPEVPMSLRDELAARMAGRL